MRAAINAPWNVSDTDAPLNPAVLLNQASVFNACCRIYAPRYRQASLGGLNNDAALDLAYTDVARAFRHFAAHANHGRPIIIASHSQGTNHARIWLIGFHAQCDGAKGFGHGTTVDDNEDR